MKIEGFFLLSQSLGLAPWGGWGIEYIYYDLDIIDLNYKENDPMIELSGRRGVAHNEEKKELKMTGIINTKIPEFSVQAFHKGEFKTVKSEDLKGKWSVFFFYPADFTFVCPTELGDLADHYQEFQSLGVEIYSVSTDTHFVHKAWHDTSETIKKINYPMLADPRGQLTRAFGVHIEEEGLAYRGTFVVDPEGLIKIVEIQDNSVGRDAQELLRKVKAAQYVANHDGEVCPAKWREGADTLKPSLDLVGKI